MYKFLLCVRMLRQRRITWLCIIGVMLGLGALIVVHSVMGGFAHEVRKRLRGTLADVSISLGQSGFPRFLPDRSTDEMETVDIVEVIRGVEGVKAASPVLDGIALIKLPHPLLGDDFTRMCYFWGIVPEEEAEVTRLTEWLNNGRGRRGQEAFLLEGREVENPIILGRELDTARIRAHGPDADVRRARGEKLVRDEIIIDTGKPVVLTTVTFHGSTVGGRGVTNYGQFIVVDTWKSGMADLDKQMTFMPLELAQALRKMPGRLTRIHVRLEDYREVDTVKTRLRQVLDERFGPFIVTTWEEERSTLLSAVAVEQNIMVFLLFLIMVVAGFMIMAILLMIVTEKVRDIGIIRALGGSRRGVASIFLAFGLAIGTVGCILGTGLGLLLAYNINVIEGWIEKITGRKVFDREIYYFDEIPAEVSPVAILIFIAGVLVLCFAMSVFSAVRAAKLEPVEAIRYE